jgi:hypothetical protein
MINVYGSIIDEVQAKNNDVNLIMKEMLVRAESLKRDFTKRQMNIIGFIFTFSFAYGKEWALIPKMKDFEIAGISSVKIRNEIDQLIEMGVVNWNQEEMLFSINDPREWHGAPYHSTYNDVRSRELFVLNVQHAGIDIGVLTEKT